MTSQCVPRIVSNQSIQCKYWKRDITLCEKYSLDHQHRKLHIDPTHLCEDASLSVVGDQDEGLWDHRVLPEDRPGIHL